MAKKDKKVKNINDENGYDDSEKSGFAGFVLALAIIAIWLVIIALLIKMNVGGVGSMLRPFLKDIPVISMILPEATDDEIQEETGYKYKNLGEAIERIKELEKQVASYQDNEKKSAETIAQLQAEIERLKVYEEQQDYYLELKAKFDSEIVYTDNAPDIENYKSWYEEMSPDNAATIYKEVCEKIQYSEEVKSWAETYAKMDAESAAAILEEMTGDTDLVAKILLCMTSKQRAAIMAEMDSVYAAKLTKIMYP